MARGGFSDNGSNCELRILAGRWVRWLVPVLYLMAALAFLSDIYRDNMLAYGVIYVPLVATSVYHERGAGLWILTLAACAMVVIGGIFPAVNPDLPDMIGNRVLSILAILATAAFVRHARATQERLAAETRRAEAAERIKSEVLTNLSQEMRMPMHVLLGTISLMMVNCRPDQREALARLRSGGKQLLETINNLIDLTQIDEHRLQRQRIDMSNIARDAVAGARVVASERQITVAMDGLNSATALGDAWATRRVLDNLLANAIRLSPPGGAVSLSIERGDDTVAASVSDSGQGMPAELARHFQDDAPDEYGTALPAAGGTGLALSNRLARTMQGRLTVHETAAAGTRYSGAVVSLSLPAG